MNENSLENNSASIQSPSERPNIIMFIVLLYWLFIPDYVLIPHVVIPILNAVRPEPFPHLVYAALDFSLNFGIPILAYILYMAFSKQRAGEMFSLGKLNPKAALCVAALTAAIRSVDMLAMQSIPFFFFGSTPAPSSASFWQMLIVAALFAALFEEFVFRGFLYGEYRSQRVSIWKTALATGLFFGLVHSGIFVFTTGIFGVFWAFMLFYTRSVWAPVLSHILYNGLGTALDPAFYVGGETDTYTVMVRLTIIMAIMAVISIPVTVICIKKFFKENPIEKESLPKESNIFAVTYWILIATMIAAIFIFRL